jgi:hypothetical protein
MKMSISYNQEAARGIQHNSMAPNITFDDQDINPLLRTDCLQSKVYTVPNIKAGLPHFLGAPELINSTIRRTQGACATKHKIAIFCAVDNVFLRAVTPVLFPLTAR